MITRSSPHFFIALAAATSLAGCTTNATTPDAREQASACAAPAGNPLRFELTIDEVHTPIPLSMPVLVATGEGRAPYLVKLRGDACGPRARIAYSVTRVATDADAFALLRELGPPPGVTLPVDAPVASATQHFEGTRDLARGQTVVLGEGVWPDAQPYRVSVNAY